jgi:hypothetical protein
VRIHRIEGCFTLSNHRASLAPQYSFWDSFNLETTAVFLFKNPHDVKRGQSFGSTNGEQRAASERTKNRSDAELRNVPVGYPTKAVSVHFRKCALYH